jgi:hypothetical protein
VGLTVYCLPASLMEPSAMRSVAVVFSVKTSLYLPTPYGMAPVGGGMWSAMMGKAFLGGLLIATMMDHALSVLWPLQSNIFPSGSCELKNLEEELGVGGGTPRSGPSVPASESPFSVSALWSFSLLLR